MMKGLGAATLAAGFGGLYGAFGPSHAEAAQEPRKLGECRLPPLPYPAEALEPHIDAKTVALHHEKHHAAYVNGFNAALAKLEESRASGDFQLIKHWSRELAFHGSGHVLHTLYWFNMAPAGGAPEGDLAKAMEKSFGSYDAFQKQFTAATNAVEASGWGILAYEPFRGYLVVLQAEKHQDLAIWGVYPLLVCDVWEHAYYLKYQNQRGEYVKNFMKIINWKEVQKRYDAVKGLKAYS
jgi:Fe-Mn family superoxide dismutase